MDSIELTEAFGFGHWLEVGRYISGEARILPSFAPPGRSVVYAMRLVDNAGPRLFGRFCGSSDLLRIGMSDNFGTVQGQRLFNYRANHQKPNERVRTGVWHVHEVLACLVEIGWVVVEADTDPRDLESALLERYFREHQELPPWNRSG